MFTKSLITNLAKRTRRVSRYSCLSSNVRVRFAPSPTGELHLGSLRTALFNYLFAKKYNGAFIMRLEDTDQERIIEGVEGKIEETLGYFGLKLDESPLIGGDFGPYKQSERLSTYKDAADRLIDAGQAYKCFCSPERLNILRKKCLNEKLTPRYDLHCRGLSGSNITAREKAGEVPVVRFKFDPGETRFKDMVYGDYFHKWEESDFIILKRDGFPTYHFANVVDDHLMQITHVIRGSEWLISTPKHIKIHSAFGWDPPKFVHLPLITQDGHRKMSKRNAATFVNYYSELGYLPLAVLNFLLRNGSGIRSHDTHRLYSLEEMVESFDENLIGKSPFMMDMKELDRYGRMSFQKADFKTDLLPVIGVQFSLLNEEARKSINPTLLQEDYFKSVILFLKSNEEAFNKVSDITTGDFRFFFMMPKSADKLLERFPNIEQTISLMDEFLKLLRTGKYSFNELKVLAKDKQVQPHHLTTILRLSVIDNISGPPISELVEFLGKKEIEKRLVWMIELLGRRRNKEEILESTNES